MVVCDLFGGSNKAESKETGLAFCEVHEECAATFDLIQHPGKLGSQHRIANRVIIGLGRMNISQRASS